MNTADSSTESDDYARAAGCAAIARIPAARRFRPRLLPTLAAALLVPLFVAFGQWQWNKAGIKGERQALRDARSAEAPLQLPATPVDAETLRYRRVVVRGSYEPAQQILIDNRIYREEAGYHVLTPLRIEGSQMRVLVNRGWIAALAEHHRLPEVATPDGVVEVSGMAVVPGTRFFTLGGAKPGSAQRVWQNPDLPGYARTVGFPLQPVLIELAPESPAGGFARDWPRPDERRERHVGYALQWWGFALATLAIWIAVNFRREPKS
ncbi:MAG: SURF1 family protein [Rhodocyclaceae bacterium]